MQINETVGAGASLIYGDQADFFRILDADSLLTIIFYRAGREAARAENVGAGYSERFREPFDQIKLFSTVAQSFSIVTRLGNFVTYDKAPQGDVNVLNFPANQVVTVSNPNDQKQYFEYGASFKSNTALAANVAEMVFSAAANVAGAIIWTADLCASETGGGKVSGLLAKATAPVSITDGDLIMAAKTGFTVAAGISYYVIRGELLRPVFIPAGKGLYFITSNSDVAANALRSVLYTLK